ncbi:hypothetical protein QBC43DRAFT_285156 [Cladorrhinum sp. PSN259]|nr:hypothetical protein QBC43DRAFT_285156 [Cladorrhinum sp. PSN259]
MKIAPLIFTVAIVVAAPIGDFQVSRPDTYSQITARQLADTLVDALGTAAAGLVSGSGAVAGDVVKAVGEVAS